MKTLFENLLKVKWYIFGTALVSAMASLILGSGGGFVFMFLLFFGWCAYNIAKK